MPLELEVGLDCPDRELRTLIKGSEILATTIDVGDLRDLHEDGPAVETVAGTLRENLVALTRTPPEAAVAGQDLVDAVTSELARLSSDAVASATARRPSELVIELVERFREEAEAAGCGACPLSGSCSHGGVDYRPLDHDGTARCLRAPAVLVGHARDMVAEIYARYLPGLRAKVAVEVCITNNDAGRTIVDGATLWEGSPDRRASVTLKVPPVLPAPVFYSLFYVALHEIGVHAVQEMVGMREPVPPATHRAFAEGFVDEAVTQAARHLERGEFDRDLHRALRAIEDRRGERAREDYKGEDWPLEIRRGVDAFETLLGLGREIGRARAADERGDPPCFEGIEWACRAAFALNVAPLDEVQRDRLVGLLRERVLLETPDRHGVMPKAEVKRRLDRLCENVEDPTALKELLALIEA